MIGKQRRRLQAVVDLQAADDLPELSHVVIPNILKRLGTKELLKARRVCRRWRDANNNLELWRIIDMSNEQLEHKPSEVLESMCRDAIRRNQGGCVEFSVRSFGTGDLITYLVDNCRCIIVRLLCPEGCRLIIEVMNEAIPDMTELVELELCRVHIRQSIFGRLQQHSPNLRVLKINDCLPEATPQYYDEVAWSIASIEDLKELELRGFNLMNMWVEYIDIRCEKA